MMYSRLLTVWSTLVLLTGCIEVAQDEREQQLIVQYRVEYSTYDQRLRAEAHLQLRDTLEAQPYFLEQPVTFDGTDMQKQYQRARGLYYLLQQTRPLPDTLAFSFVDYQGRSRPYTSVMHPVDRIRIIGSDYFERGFSVSFEDHSTQSDSADYTLVLVDADNVLHHLDRLTRVSSKRVQVTPAQLGKVAPGRATVLLSKVTHEQHIRDGISYTGTLSWVSRPLYVRLEQ